MEKITLNVIVTLFAIPVLVFVVNMVLKRWFTRFASGWEKYEALKDQNNTEWRTNFSTSLTTMQKTLDTFVDKFHTVVTEDYCESSHTDIEKTLADHGNRITVLETRADMKK